MVLTNDYLIELIIYKIEETEVYFNDIGNLGNNLNCNIVEAHADLKRAKIKLEKVIKEIDK